MHMQAEYMYMHVGCMYSNVWYMLAHVRVTCMYMHVGYLHI